MANKVKLMPSPTAHKFWQVPDNLSSRGNSIPESVNYYPPKWNSDIGKFDIDLTSKEIQEYVDILELYDDKGNIIEKANIFNKRDKFFNHGDLRVKLKENAHFFDLDKPIDRLKLKILKSYKAVADSREHSLKTPSSRWYIVDEEADADSILKEASQAEEALKLFNKMTNKRKRMVLNALISMNRYSRVQIDKNTEASLISAILMRDFVDETQKNSTGMSPRQQFIAVAKTDDADLHIRDLIQRGRRAGIITIKGDAVYDRHGNKIAESIDGLVVKFSNPDYQASKDNFETELSIAER